LSAVTADLPAGWTTRRPTLDDVPAILAVIHASDIAAVGEPDFTSEEILEILQAPNHDMTRDSWVVLHASGAIVGWGYIANPSGMTRENIDAYVHPEHGTPAQAHLLDLLVARVAERAGEAGLEQLTVRAGAIASETHYVGLLRAAGFDFVKRYARMRGPLTGSERAPDLPEGVRIRTVDHTDDQEMRTFHQILNTAFMDTPDHQAFDYDNFRERLDALPAIAWDEWFIAEVDGVPAGILQSAEQMAEANEAWVKNLAVAKEFRGRGIGRLLLQTAFATYAAKGCTAVGLGVDMTNPTGAYRLYEGVGLTPFYESDVYERTVSATSI
jgi:ribosomal protein S18 acetylase RimI-like enzyme